MITQRYKKIKRDYQRKNLANPFFHKKPKGERAGAWKWFIIAGVLAISVLIWFFLSCPFWCLKKIQIKGLTRIDGSAVEKMINDQAEERCLLVFKQKNIFLFDEEEAVQKIMADYNLAGSEIKKKLPGTLEVNLSERPYAFIFQEGSNLLYASADGYVIREVAVKEDDRLKYSLIESKLTDSLVADNGKIAVKDGYLNYILDLANRLTSYQAEFLVERFIIDQESKTVTVKFKDGPAVYFNTLADATEQINRLLLVKKEKIKDNFKKTNYIDLRYGDRIFINPDFNN